MRASLQKATHVHADPEFITLPDAGRELGLTRYRTLVLCAMAGVSTRGIGLALVIRRADIPRLRAQLEAGATLQPT
jgi:hypothetical protein